MKKFSSLTAWVVVMIMVVISAVFLVKSGEAGSTIPYSDFQQKWIGDQVKSIQVKQDKMTVEGTLTNNKTFNTVVPVETLNILLANNNKPNVKVSFELPTNISVWVQIIPTVLVIFLFIAFFFIFMQQSQSGGGSRGVMNFGKSRAKMATPDKKKVTFKDVAGADEEKAELEEIVDFLKQPKRYIEMGARIPKGVLLVGPPGTGKTLLARAIAGEAGVPFFSISGSDFVEMFVGVGASRVRDLFEQAKKNAPCIIFIDEIDAVGRQRGAGLGGGHDEREQTLNQLLVEMDGFGVNEGIIMIAATNRPDILDPALLRPGRFDRQIVVGAPDVKGREEILKVHTRNKPLSDDIELKVLAKRTPGFTGADIENLANEAGHAVVAKLLPNADPVHQISIIPRGMAGGYTMHLPAEDRSYTSKSRLKDEMVGLLGGRVAEKLIMGDISTGAKNDIDRASNIARSMVMEYGMSDEVGPISFGTDHNEVFLGRDIGRSRNFSEEIGSKIDREIKGLIDEAYGKAESLLTEYVGKLHAVAQALLEKEKLEAEEFEEIFNNAL
ncbi:ATP-dependent zinc metalloprotease FtsH [Clostridium folliculivorans]|uniref:ATP-dependent zinc metalloprotease FtsH n=1 Tax=Clostridium folliculivorans TaxID=2886038 RepID=A0A9W5Y3Q4_9CLOT|nr:FtsH/Yme1/Tma family ATP-dependent metallopeptidase [Clostridium folliculivorans]GKU26154.1 ATP-dependent zinc metalloprotease FtsH [Clostridium folliculivorans]